MVDGFFVASRFESFYALVELVTGFKSATSCGEK
jgi:elongation factor P--beta-lysine ligase